MAIISKTYGKLLVILLVWLGFSCKPDDDYCGGVVSPEYGVPATTFKAKEVVVSQMDEAEDLEIIKLTPKE